MKNSKIERMWKAHGLTCKVLLTEMGHRCGYVSIVNEHPAYNMSYDDIPVQVHGGLTFESSDATQTWFGFDCAHAGDARDEHDKTGHYWTQKEVEAECERLAEQLSKVTVQDIIKEKMRWWPDRLKPYVKILNKPVQSKEKNRS